MQATFSKFLLFIGTASLYAFTSHAAEQKSYSPEERRIEEARISTDIKESLDWNNRPPETRDDLPDDKRWLYARANESVLLRRSTGERFGIFESFDDKTNKRIFEIRLHNRSRLTDRFRPFQNNCDGDSLSAEKVDPHFVLYREICSAHNRPTGYSLYLFDYASRGLYWIYTAKAIDQKKPTISLVGETYKIRWNFCPIGSKEFKSIARNFRLKKNEGERWIAIELPPHNEKIDEIAPVEKLPVTPEYNLPRLTDE